ncbi:MAG: hypothetical protein ABIH42_04920 [Planctomycetota bacterium]
MSKTTTTQKIKLDEFESKIEEIGGSVQDCYNKVKNLYSSFNYHLDPQMKSISVRRDDDKPTGLRFSIDNDHLVVEFWTEHAGKWNVTKDKMKEQWKSINRDIVIEGKGHKKIKIEKNSDDKKIEILISQIKEFVNWLKGMAIKKSE